MVKEESVVKLSNLAPPCSGKESKASCGYLESYRAMPAYSRRNGCVIRPRKQKELPGFKVTLM